MKNCKIFLGLREMAGYIGSLQKGFSELGIESHFLDIGGSPFCYTSGVNSGWLNFCNKWIGKLAFFSYKNQLLRLFWLGFLQNFIALFFFPWAFFTHNAFIFCSNSTFFFFLELPLLKLFRKKVIYIFLGSESRPVYCTGKVKISKKNVKHYKLMIKLQKLWIRWIEKFSDCIVSIPPQAMLHEKPFVSIMTVGYPCRFENAQITPSGNTRVRVLHSPSNRATKGSDEFLRIVQELKAEGVDFDYKEITGVPNAQVIEEIKKSDIILDELYSDSPMAGLTTEAAAAGRPSVVGSYYAEIVRDDVLAADLPPSAFVLPEQIKETLRNLIREKAERETLGANAAKFVAEKWSCRKSAEAYWKLLSGNIPEFWWFQPSAMRYACGYGLSREQLKQNILLLTEKYGMESLCLGNKPGILEYYSELIKNDKKQ